MFSDWTLSLLSIGYILVLFVIAYLGDKYRHQMVKKTQAMIYAMTLGVYCTSWSFLGTTGQASNNVFSHVPIYLGPILLFIFAWGFIQRVIKVSIKLNLTSIADLLAARFGKSHNLAIMVTMVALIGTMPYLALQLKAIVYSFSQLQLGAASSGWQLGFFVSLGLAVFTIIFGIRNIDVTERHPGVMLAIAFESVVKLLSFVAVGLFVSFFLFDSPGDIWQQASQDTQLQQALMWPDFGEMLAMLVVVMAAFLVLPRQFQVMVVEVTDEKDTQLSRKLFPLYLLVFALFAAPLGLAGHLLLGDSVPSDTYVLFLPEHGQQHWLTLLAFLGAISAASSMVIISSIALSTMLSNEIVFPLLFQSGHNRQTDYDRFRRSLLNIRKVLVVFVIMLGYSAFVLASPDTLSSLGEIAFGAFAQLAPALFAAFYWRKASLTGVYGGIIVGFSLWLMLNVLPHFGLMSLSVVSEDGVSNSIISMICLAANVVVMVLLSLLSRQTVQERVQASTFLQRKPEQQLNPPKLRNIDINELHLLAAQFVGEQKAKERFADFQQQVAGSYFSDEQFNQLLLQHTESTIATVMGSSSARLVLTSALQGRDIGLDELATLVGDASKERQQIGEYVLQSAIENASQGISIVDSELKLVAWNKQYLELFDYPEGLIFKGCPVEKLIRFNATRGLCGAGDIEQQVAKRLAYLRQGSAHQSERQQDNGRTIRIEGNPLPGGGFVMLFSDITVYRQAEQVLKEANLDLESRVTERTQLLAQTNEELAKARKRAEQAAVNKSQYLKACSHDLMQPLEAARLFTSALANQNGLSGEQHRLVDNIDHSLKVANDLLTELGEIARIESGNIKPNPTAICLDELFTDLSKEFSAAADDLEVEFKVARTKVWVHSDRKLLRRILQNLLGNAFRYASPGKVLLGLRRVGGKISIVVLDNGPGIAKDKQAMVFEQFTQIEDAGGRSAKGLGLGLNISRSLANLLGHGLALRSAAGRGCTFSVTLEKAKSSAKPAANVAIPRIGLKNVSVMCIDNDPAVLNGMVELLSSWQCRVLSAESFEQAQQVFTEHKNEIEILLVDYQLNNNQDGLTLIDDLRDIGQRHIPAILITAATDVGLEDKANDQDVGFMRKLVKPAALRAMMSALLAKRLRDDYS